jgi:hypothetical protein
MGTDERKSYRAFVFAFVKAATLVLQKAVCRRQHHLPRSRSMNEGEDCRKDIGNFLRAGLEPLLKMPNPCAQTGLSSVLFCLSSSLL